MYQKKALLDKGRYRLTPVSSASKIDILSSDGQVYHTRDMFTGDMEVNILHPDYYTFSCFCKVEDIGPIESRGENIKLCLPERFRHKPIEIRQNPYLTGTPARINTHSNPAVIEIGPQFYQYPKQIRLFILLHEYGHLFYGTEWKVDRFAVKCFLGSGFNESQAYYALAKVLKPSPQAEDRINKILLTIKNEFDEPE